eukprot:gnl/TRDRNA2_/TRDRNA2_168381_c2_seq1.p1 gnl/TRDRNA2_/TRDRNA2_168381_c2~~gnl/TRDRNA2_/TRDRNA2_168381_c2_seq1.p1  ORF type:complete len:456 (+),score=61.97 gnl/TRDRNA2_/TRDRNA2_168381_c2_seq1:22-1368(+)
MAIYEPVPRTGFVKRLTRRMTDAESDGASSMTDGLSATEVGTTVANYIIGSALFTIPYFFVEGGWMTLSALVVGAAVMLFSAFLLSDVLKVCEDEGHEAPGYGIIGILTFGPSFKALFEVFCVGEVFFVAVFFLVFIGHSLHDILGSAVADVHTIIACSTAAGTLMFYIPQRYLGFLAMLGLFLTLVATVSIVGSGLVLVPDRVNTSQSLLGTVGLTSLPRCISGLAVAIGDHAIFPGLYEAAVDARSFKQGLVIGFMMFTVLAVALCVVSYWTFGTALDNVALNNIGEDTNGEPDGVIPASFTFICNMLLVARTLTVFPNFVKPAIVLVTAYCGEDYFLPNELENEIDLLCPSPVQFLRRSIIVCTIFGMVGFCSVLCTGIISELDCLVGSLFKSVNVIIIPCAGYLKICASEGGTAKRTAIFALLVLGVLWGVQGTVSFVHSVLSK